MLKQSNVSDKFSLQDIQEILDSFDVIQQTAPTSDKEYHKVFTTETHFRSWLQLSIIVLFHIVAGKYYTEIILSFES